MSKEQKSNKEVKKKATLTPKERKAAKKAKKEATKSQHHWNSVKQKEELHDENDGPEFIFANDCGKFE